MRGVFLAAVAAPIIAVFGMGGQGRAFAGSLQDETLIVAVPQGFKIADQGEHGAMTISEYVPQGETPSSWTRMVTVQVFHNLKRFDPDKFAENIKSQWLKACDDSEVHQIKEGADNNFPYSVWVYACPLNEATGKPENMFIKVISGNDSLYSVQFAYRAVLTPDNIAPAMSYLDGVRACDARRVDRPCPSAPP